MNTLFTAIKSGYKFVLMTMLTCCLQIFQVAGAQDTTCPQGSLLQQSFSSGASWSVCATVSHTHGLAISNVYYRAPGDTSRSVLSEAQVAQILLHYHDKSTAEPQFSPSTNLTEQSRQTTIQRLSQATCMGDVTNVGEQPESVCSRVENNRTLAKYAQRESLHSEAWELSATVLRESLTLSISWTFTEDGQIQPEVSVSGRAARTQLDEQFSQNIRSDLPRLTRATILSTWRLVPALDTDSLDTVEQFDFPLLVTDQNRRPMQISAITEEAFVEVDRQQFRGWRLLDESGAGYYLDPANQGYGYSSSVHHWANYEVAFTRYNACEQYALENPSSTETCGANLDDFVNAESLLEQQVVMWYSQAHLLNPSIEDWPILGDVQIGFDLLPFDWTDTSPFEVVE
ncbi:MAG: hypothetical protein AB8B84_03175 [Granulosicoccus sp.]